MKKTYITVLLILFSFIYAFDNSGNSPKKEDTPKQFSKGDPSEPLVALTIDDGPHQEFTPRILEILKDNDVKATFFIVGKMAEKYPELIQAHIEGGHEIGNHTFNHPRVTQIPKEELIDELENTRKLIVNIAKKTIWLFRPPAGKYNEEIANIAFSLGYVTVTWSINSNDYGNNSAKSITDKVVKEVQNGAVILIHDGVEATITALPTIIKEIKKKGYKFVTIPELIAAKRTAQLRANGKKQSVNNGKQID